MASGARGAPCEPASMREANIPLGVPIKKPLCKAERLFYWYTQRDLNPCRRRERAVS